LELRRRFLDGTKIQSLDERIGDVESDAANALKKSEEIEKNYIKRFDGLREEIQKVGSSLTETILKEISKVNIAIEKNNTENQ
jgi:hypothetical protein